MTKKTISQTESLSELLTVIDYEDQPVVQEGEADPGLSLEIYARELVPEKVDAITYFIDREGYAVDADEQYAKDLLDQANKRKAKYERLKKYFANVLFIHGHGASNKLRGRTGAIWFSTTKVVSEEAEIPEEFIKRSYLLMFDKAGYDSLPEDIKRKALSIELKEKIDKMGIKEKHKTEPQACVVENHHLKIGKSNSRNDEEEEE